MTSVASPGAPVAAIALEGLDVPFGSGAGLTDVTLSVAKGERVAVVGPSGVGKTTLLRAVAGLAPVRSGHVYVGGRDVTTLPPERRDAVYLHQTPVLFAHLSVAENVAFPLRVRRRGRDETAARVRQALAAVRLAEFGERRVQALSGGQRHRVALARAIAARPAALLLDEPLSALDPSLRDDVRAAIAAAQDEYHPGMLLVTHDLDDAGLLADRVAVLLAGRIAQVAPPTVLFAKPASLAVARFLGIFQELPGRVRADGRVECAAGVVPPPGLAPGAAVVVVFRPEALRIDPAQQGAAAARIVGLRHRVRGSGVVLRIGGDTAPAEVEAAVAGGCEGMSTGSEVSVALDPGAAHVFPAG